jgi:hypothetical protein
MGYIGLLLNAPYKIDSMVWMSLMSFVYSLLSISPVYAWAKVTKGQNEEKDSKCG